MLVKKHILYILSRVWQFLHQKFFLTHQFFKYIYITLTSQNYLPRNHHCLLLQPGPLKLGVQRLVATAPAFEQHTPPFGNFFFLCELLISWWRVFQIKHYLYIPYPSKQSWVKVLQECQVAIILTKRKMIRKGKPKYEPPVESKFGKKKRRP